jgi:hypothetical protein
VTAVRIGRITTGRRARIHLSIDGRTGCGARHRAHVGYECARPDLAQAKTLCRRCFTPGRAGAAQSVLITATGPNAARNRSLLAGVVEGMKTPAQRAADEDLAARIRADLIADGVLTPMHDAFVDTIRIAPAVQKLPVGKRVESWAQIRAANLRTHHQPTAA